MDTTPTTGKKVLVIEDEHFITELYNRALTKAGYDAKFILDGIEGLKEAQTDAYDLILLDIMVPNMTGIEILKHLRESNPNLKAKVIIATNLEQSDENRKMIESQADGYVIKAELTPRQLVDFLAKIK